MHAAVFFPMPCGLKPAAGFRLQIMASACVFAALSAQSAPAIGQDGAQWGGRVETAFTATIGADEASAEPVTAAVALSNGPEAGVAEMVSLEPVVAEPVALGPIAAAPVSFEPAAPEPVALGPIVSEPIAMEPIAAEPITIETVAAEAVALEPIAIETVAAEPVAPEPDMAEMVALEPVVAEPVALEPIVAAPVAIESASVTAPAAEVVYVDAPLDMAPQDSAGFGPAQGVAISPPRPPMAPAYAPIPYGGALSGDGRYGPSIIDTGYGAATQEAELHVSKAAVVRLPVAAREVIVSDPEIVRAILRTDTQLVLIGARLGQTNVFVFDESGDQILNLQARVEYDFRPLRSVLARQYPHADLSLETVLGEVILNGAARSASEATEIEGLIRRYLASVATAAGSPIAADDIEIANRLSGATDGQVMLKVRVAEMRRSLVRQLGVNLTQGARIAQALTGNFTTANAFTANGASLGGLAATLGFNDGSSNISALLRAFERNAVMRTLAEPTLTAVTGETASFLAGGQFAYPVSVEDGQVGYDFRDVGVALEFTPVVLDEGRISLRVATEISELTNEGALTAGDFTIPGLAVRRANTTVELPSGGSMVMAGMLQQRESATYDGVPGIKQIPILGRLFSSSDFQRNETELVILVTAYLVKPGQENDFNLPTDGFAPASAVDFYLLGRLNAVYGAGEYDRRGAMAAAEAPIGFIME